MTVVFIARPPRRPNHSVLYLCARDRQVMRDGRLAFLEPQAFAVMVLLATNGEHLTTLRDVEELLWGDAADGGPEDTTGILKQHIRAIRLAAGPMGVMIETWRGEGFRFRKEG